MLKGIDGGEVRVRRKTNSYDFKPYLTLVLAVQPKILSNLGHNRAYSGNGSLERFLYVLPKSKLGYRTHDKPPLTDSIQQAYSAKVRALLNTFATGKTEDPKLLTLDPAALKPGVAFSSISKLSYGQMETIGLLRLGREDLRLCFTPCGFITPSRIKQ